MQSGADNMPAMCPDLFERLLLMTDLAVHPPKLNKVELRTSASGRATQVMCWCCGCDSNRMMRNDADKPKSSTGVSSVDNHRFDRLFGGCLCSITPVVVSGLSV